MNDLNTSEAKVIHVNMSEQCNLDCSFCCIGRPKTKGSLDADAFIAWFKDFRGAVEGSDCNCIAINFSGGEPALQVDSILKIIEGTKSDNMYFSVLHDMFSNMTYEITPKIKKMLEQCSVSTSWDPISDRFATQEQFELWKRNCQEFQPEQVSIVMTTEILKLEPVKLFKDFASWGINSIHFQKLHATGTAIISNLASPKWEDVDNWLCRAYDDRNSDVEVAVFEDYKRSCMRNLETFEEYVYRCVEDNKMTISADGSISTCCLGVTDKFSSIYEPIENLITHPMYTQLGMKSHVRSECRVCKLYQFCDCNCPRLSWNDKICPFPKKLFKKIVMDNNPNILASLDF